MLDIKDITDSKEIYKKIEEFEQKILQGFIICLVDEDKYFDIDHFDECKFIHKSSVWNHDKNKWEHFIETDKLDEALVIKFQSDESKHEARTILESNTFEDNLSYDVVYVGRYSYINDDGILEEGYDDLLGI